MARASRFQSGLSRFGLRVTLLVGVCAAISVQGPAQPGVELLRLLASGASGMSWIMAAAGLLRRSRMEGRGWTEWDDARAFTIIALVTYLAFQAARGPLP